MQARALLALPLLLGALLTGCIGGGDETPQDEETVPQGGDGVLDANETTTAPDGRGDISAFKETNRTEVGKGGMMHSHDYWNGETRKIIWQSDGGLIPFPLIPEGKAPGTAIADFDIPAPALVYEGTSQLEVVFNDVCAYPQEGDVCPAGHPLITIYLDYLTAADEPGAFRAAGKATPGQPLIIPVAPTEADMPHQTKSLWIFRIYTGEANAWTYNITVTAVKGGAVVDWPPHPDLYADKTERVIFDSDVRIENKGTADYLVFASLPEWHHPDRVISYGTEKLEVTITDIRWGNQPPVAPEKFILETHNASYLPRLGNSDQAGARFEDPASDGTTYKFTVPVDPAGFDTPYGQKSRWGFHFLPRWTDATNCLEGLPAYNFLQQFVVGCQWFPYDITYHMKIVAYGHSTAEGVEDLAAQGSGPVA